MDDDDTWYPLDLQDLPWTVAVQVEAVDGVEEVVGLRLTPRRGEDGLIDRNVVISKEGLRGLPLRRLRAEAWRASPRLKEEVPWGAVVPSERPSGRPYPREHYKRVASAYEIALEMNRPPIDVIRNTWRVSRPTAAKWVSRARELGVLGYPEKRGRPGSSADTSPYPRKEATP